jgi:hypothetical protein
MLLRSTRSGRHQPHSNLLPPTPKYLTFAESVTIANGDAEEVESRVSMQPLSVTLK